MKLSYNGEEIHIKNKASRVLRLFRKFAFMNGIRFESINGGEWINAHGKMKKTQLVRRFK
ncbi:U exon protein [Equine adenovirus 2]|uniref:U exon protein n=1 Tax=Equine adenovirus B serotype 2 TaxID=67603 RepID=A0A0K1DCS6_ADEE2|nr:U exon protein [Equine adenovirus 2]AKT26039.1 U exon protein [Equine adenovirus 2]